MNERFSARASTVAAGLGLGRAFALAVVVSVGAVAQACGGEPTADDGPVSASTLEALRAYDIHRVELDGDAFALLDLAGQRVGTVTPDAEQGYGVELRGYDAGAWLRGASLEIACGERHVALRQDGGDWEPVEAGVAPPEDACIAALAVGQLLTAQAGHGAPLLQPQCSTFSGWVWGYDCLSCYASIPGQGYEHQSCSYGWASTTCKRSTCPFNGYELEMVVEQ